MPLARLLLPALLAAAIALLAVSLAPDLAWGASTGGASAGAGGGSGSAAPLDSGGAPVGVGTTGNGPVAPVFHLMPRSITVGAARPRIVLRVDQPTSPTVKASIRIVAPSGASTTRTLGAIPTGTSLTRSLPSSLKLVAGTYTFRLSVTDRTGQRLKTSKTGTGTARLTVLAKAAPPPTTTTDPGIITPDPTGTDPTAVSSTTSVTGDRFPVQGPHTFGGPAAAFGAGRVGHIHQGQDVVADAGLPVVAPTAGTITATGYQAAAAGEWIAMHSVDGRDFFFAHCIRTSTVVAAGAAVVPGTRLCSLGATGDASGPHLHFEIWIDGWRTSSASHPIDPLPQLKQWQAADPTW